VATTPVDPQDGGRTFIPITLEGYDLDRTEVECPTAGPCQRRRTATLRTSLESLLRGSHLDREFTAAGSTGVRPDQGLRIS